MRLALAALVLVAGVGPGWGGNSKIFELQRNHVGCSNPQDLIDFVRLAKQSGDNGGLNEIVLRGFTAKIDSGLCHQYTKGTPVSVINRKTIQGFDVECLRDEGQSTCFYVLAPAS